MYTKELRKKIDQFDQKTKECIYQFIQDCLVDMGFDQDEINPDSLLNFDLGMGSIDFLDLTCRLEEQYKISLPRNGLRANIREIIPDEEFSKEGIITDRGLELLKELFQGKVKGMIKPGLTVNQLPELGSIETFIHLTVSQLLLKPNQANLEAPFVDQESETGSREPDLVNRFGFFSGS